MQGLFLARRQPRALEIQGIHPERRRSHGDLAADLAKSDDADRAAVQVAGSADATEIAARHVSAVERLVRKFRSCKLLDTDEPADAMNPPCERERQREGVFRARDIGASAHAENLDAGGGASGGINISKDGAVFVNDL